VPCDVSAREVFQRLAGLLPSDAVWVTSHLQRTAQTADAILAEMTPAAPSERLCDAHLGEQSFGDWQGLTHDELAQQRAGAWHRFWLAPAHERPPGGESFEDLVERVGPAVARLNETYGGRDIVAVLALALEIVPERALAFEIANCSLTRLDFVAGPSGSHLRSATGAWRVGQVNMTP
jgi:broad specificity phosphatase PhoE